MINQKASREMAQLLGRVSLAFFLALPCSAATLQPVAGIFVGAQPDLAREIGNDIKVAGYATEFIDSEVLTNSASLRSLHFDLLVLPHASALPAASMDAVRDFLRGGGRMMALGLPAWSSPTFAVAGQWISKQELQRRMDQQVADHVIMDFAREDLSRWNRSVEGATTTTKVKTGAVDKEMALHVTVDNLGGWDTLASPPLSEPFPDGRTLTCFRARGAPGTRAMSLEWDEKDGSRWIATIELGTDWKSYCLTPESFHFWESTQGRGGAEDRLDVRNAVRLNIGLARSHGSFTGAHHEYWIGNIGSARSPFPAASPDAVKPPLIDTVSPDWKFYSIHGDIRIGTAAGLALVSPVNGNFISDNEKLPQAMHPRPRGVGFNQGRPWRWQPLLEAHSPDGDYRGAMGALLMHFDDEFRGGIWACFTPDDPAFYQQESVRQLIQQTAYAMRRGLFLQEGGSEFFTVFDGQSFRLGASAVNLGTTAQTNLTLRLSVKSKKSHAGVFAREWPVTVSTGGTTTVQEQWKPERWPAGGLTVTAELAQDGKIIDRLENELNAWQPRKKPEFIEERDGQFLLRGKSWKANGVNYMPATGIAVSSGDYFECWLGKGAYDPEAIERDLRRIKAMHLNAVSIFIYHSSLPAQHLLDFLRRCDALGLHVNLSLRPGTPLDFQWDKMKALIEFYRMAENDTIFAYDLAWEAEHVDEQNSYGRDWTSWATKHYGAVAQARSVWGAPAPALDNSGVLAVPPLIQLAHDGPWRNLVADYRAFLDDELALKYGEARRLVHSIDPNHAVSFRMSEAGDPTLNSDSRLPFDFYGLAKAVDIWEPEAYGRIGDWERVRAGRFEVDYARLCDPKKPLIWAEMGNTVWDDTRNEASPEKLAFTAQFYRDFYRMMRQSGSDGVFFWWYAGGYRANEKTDFGIINPDGTDRAVTRVIREEGPGFLKATKPAKANYFISIDRDRDARGLFGIYEAVNKDYWQAIDEGKIPALQWERKPGQR